MSKVREAVDAEANRLNCNVCRELAIDTTGDTRYALDAWLAGKISKDRTAQILKANGRQISSTGLGRHRPHERSTSDQDS